MIKKFIAVNESEIIEFYDVSEHLGIPLPDVTGSNTFKDATRSFQKEFIKNRLIKNNNNVTDTAVELDLARPYLHRLIKMFNIDIS